MNNRAVKFWQHVELSGLIKGISILNDAKSGEG